MQLDGVMNCLLTQKLFVQTKTDIIVLKPCNFVVTIPNDKEEWGAHIGVGTIAIDAKGEKIKWIPFNKDIFKSVIFIQHEKIWNCLLQYLFTLFTVSSLQFDIYHSVATDQLIDEESIIKICKKTPNIPMHLKQSTFKYVEQIQDELLYTISCNIILSLDHFFCFDCFFDCVETTIVKFKWLQKRKKLQEEKNL